MNDYWLSAEAQYRADDIRREMEGIHRAQSIRPSKSTPLISRLLSAIKIAAFRQKRETSHERAGRAILAVD